MSYTTISQLFILVNSIRNDMILISELRCSKAPYSPDTDRGLTQDMTAADIEKIKVFRRTAIPMGRYKVLITYSNRFQKNLPILLSVPGFAGIRIHSGNRHIDTEGCLLPGTTYWKDGLDYVVGTSRTACERLQSAIVKELNKGGEVWVTVKTEY